MPGPSVFPLSETGVLGDFWPLLIATGEAIPLRGLEGVPGLPGAKKFCLRRYVPVCILSRFSHVRLFATLWVIAHQALQSVGFSRQEY